MYRSPVKVWTRLGYCANMHQQPTQITTTPNSTRLPKPTPFNFGFWAGSRIFKICLLPPWFLEFGVPKLDPLYHEIPLENPLLTDHSGSFLKCPRKQNRFILKSLCWWVIWLSPFGSPFDFCVIFFIHKIHRFLPKTSPRYFWILAMLLNQTVQ